MRLVNVESKSFKIILKGLVHEAIDALIEKDDANTQSQERRVRMELLPDGWQVDYLLGIEWGPLATKRMNWADANKYCTAIGGRLPTSKELMSLIDHGRHEPAIIEPFVKDTPFDYWHWTGNRCVWPGSSSAWCVSFDDGSVYYYGEYFDCYVRPVRASQCRPLTF